ncbi:FixH family protein [Duganella sp. LjRoot269]|uniref:FixH family protein n=1 Tax=Duganella sp. LjRoot269 TaxID=3342305 RepID=UPI003ED156A9
MSVTMTMTTATPWWKQRWPWLLMAGPALVVVAGTYTGWLAFSQQDALVVGDYYKQGKAINQDLRRDRLASSLGLSVSLGYDATQGLLAGQLRRRTDDHGRTERLFVHLSHATLPEKDIKLVVQPDEFGMFQINLPMLERSRWVVLVEGEKRDWRLAGTWSWPGQREVTLSSD